VNSYFFFYREKWVQRTSSSGVGSDYETCAERDVGDVSVWLMSGEVRVNEERSCRVSGVLNRAPRAGKKKKERYRRACMEHVFYRSTGLRR
jgi:hypothetical protein